MRKITMPRHRSVQPKPRLRGVANKTRWWVDTEAGREAKATANEMALAFVGGDEQRFITPRNGTGVYSCVKIIWPQWLKKHRAIARRYERDHGKPLTHKILADRVDKMYSITRVKNGVRTKGRGLSSEHPDNSPSYSVRT